MHDPIVMAELHRLGATYEVVNLGRIAGDCNVIDRHARINIGTEVEMRCSLMHELGHIHFGHIPTGDPERDAHMEAEADRWAALKLITPTMLAWALSFGRDRREAAEMLCVDPNTLTARIAATAEQPKAVLSLLKAEMI